MAAHRFSQNYKESLFILYYEKGRPPIRAFWNYIPDDENGEKPSIMALRTWANDTWIQRADINDEKVREQINAKMIGEKTEMLSRHASVGETMQGMALKYLDDHKEDLSVSASVRMLVEGVRIERDSRGIGTAFRSMLKSSDEELLSDIEQLYSKSGVEIQQLEDGED
jgi:hypothetical protein